MLKALAAICCLARDEEGDSYCIPDPKLVPERERESSSPFKKIKINILTYELLRPLVL
jgi:hypothetical protein